jgi:hypothetical protein
VIDKTAGLMCLTLDGEPHAERAQRVLEVPDPMPRQRESVLSL